MDDNANKIFEMDPPLKFYVPVKIAQLEFTLKESMQLAELSRFLLTAISVHNANEEDMSDAMLLLPLVIRTELQSMYNQKLLAQDDGAYILTEQAKLLLKYEKLTEQLNYVKRDFVFNTVSGDLKIYVSEECLDAPKGITANKRLHEFELACVEPSQIKDVLLKAFPIIAETVEEPEHFLESIVIEPTFEKGDKWTLMRIERPQPNENGETIVSKDEIAIKSYIVQRKLRVYNEYFEKNMRQMEMLKDVFTFDRSLISEAGTQKLMECENYVKEKSTLLTVNIDPFDSSVFIGEFSQNEPIPKRVLFDLEYFEDLENFKWLKINGKKVKEELDKQIDLNGNLLNLESETHIPYIIRLPLESLTYCMEAIDEGS